MTQQDGIQEKKKNTFEHHQQTMAWIPRLYQDQNFLQIDNFAFSQTNEQDFVSGFVIESTK